MAKDKTKGLSRKWPEQGVNPLPYGSYPTRGTGIGSKGRGRQGEVLRSGQQSYIDQLRGTPKGKIEGKGGFGARKRVLEDQKVVKKKKKKMTMEEGARKHEDLRKKRSKMEEENKATKEKLWGDWLYPKGWGTKKGIKKRTGRGKAEREKEKKKKSESWTPPPVQGIPRGNK